MRNKKLCVGIFLLLFLFLFTGCVGTGERVTETKKEDVSQEHNSGVDEYFSFKTEPELIDYIMTDSEVQSILLKYAGNASDNTVKMNRPSAVAKEYQLAGIRHAFYYFSYDYTLDEPLNLSVKSELEAMKKNVKPSFEDGQSSQQSSKTTNSRLESETTNSERSNPPESQSTSPGDDTAISEESFESIRSLATTLTFVWTVTEDANEYLKEAIPMFELSESNVQGYYYSPISFGENFVLYSVYWVENDEFFQVNFPLQSLDVSVEEVINNNEGVFHSKEEIYSLK